ncbi:MAG: hypothetical protein ACE5F5_05830 [Acidimicrobiia bacterium]
MAIVFVPADTPGVTQGPPYQKAGMSGDANGDVWFEEARVPLEFRAHGPGEDAKWARAMITSGNVGTAAQCIGVMRNLYEIVKDWCDTRVIAEKKLKDHSITAAVLANDPGGQSSLFGSWTRSRTSIRVFASALVIRSAKWRAMPSR